MGAVRWYISTSNAGSWSWVKSEYPLDKEKSAALDDFVRVVYSGDMCFSKFELINDDTLDTIPVDCFRQTYGAELKAYDARVPHYETPVRIF